MTAYLTLTDASVVIHGQNIWSGVNFTLDRGELVGLTGPSGSGKTTLLNCVDGLMKFTGGTLTADGTTLQPAPERARRKFRRDHLGYLFQNYALVDADTVESNILDPLRIVPRRSRPSRADVSEALDRVGLAGREREKVYRLSGGEQQRVALAALLVKKPRLILADEPTGALDAANGRMVMEVLRTLTDQGSVALVATHNAEVAAACDRVLDLSPFRARERSLA